MNRDFTYKDVKFHLNDNKGNREFEGKYDLMFWTGYTGWRKIGTCSSKKDAKELIKLKLDEILYQADFEFIASKSTCNWGGIVILSCDSDYVESAELYSKGLLRKAKAQIRYNSKGDAYFMRQGIREYLNEYMKVG